MKFPVDVASNHTSHYPLMHAKLTLHFDSTRVRQLKSIVLLEVEISSHTPRSRSDIDVPPDIIARFPVHERIQTRIQRNLV